MDKIHAIFKDIKSIAYHMTPHNSVEKMIESGDDLKMGDLKTKLDLVESEIRTIIENTAEKTGVGKRKANVGIIAVTQKEFDMLNNQFKFRNKKNENLLSGNNLRSYETTIKTQVRDKKEIKLVFTKIGFPGNLYGYHVTDMLLKHYDLDLIILCGIAAGYPGKTKIYSAVASLQSIYYEMQKLKPNQKAEYRFEPIPVSTAMQNELSALEEEKELWKKYFISQLKRNKMLLTQDQLKGQSSWIKPDWEKSVDFSMGGILSGEKLFADGITFKTLADEHQNGKETLAGEMEGYGFSFACTRNNQRDWMIFRGISDFGGKEKSKTTNKENQNIAALSAASIVHFFLSHVYVVKP